MTVEHHKEEENLLTRSYKGVLQAVKTPPSRATWLVLVVVLLGAVLVGSWFWFTSSASATNSELWLKKFETPLTTTDLQRFADDPNQQGTVQGRFARAEAARREMRYVALLGSTSAVWTGQPAPLALPWGESVMITEDNAKDTYRTLALAHIAKARDTYEKLVQESGDTPALMQESLMGAAKANETLSEFGKARDFYARLAKDYPNTALAREADARVKALDDETSKQEIATVNAAPK